MRLKSSHLYYVLSFAVFFVLSLINTQLIPFMKTCGYSIEQQGILLAADAMIATAVSLYLVIYAIGIRR